MCGAVRSLAAMPRAARAPPMTISPWANRGDLGEENAGMLIFSNDRQSPEYVPWTDVEQIDLDRPPEMYPPDIRSEARSGLTGRYGRAIK